jgi:hypothetical protein
MLHQEADGITAFAATKAFVNFLGRGYRKTGCFLIMERAEAQVVRTPFFKVYEFADHFNDIDSTDDLFNGFVPDHNNECNDRSHSAFDPMKRISYLKNPFIWAYENNPIFVATSIDGTAKHELPEGGL